MLFWTRFEFVDIEMISESRLGKDHAKVVILTLRALIVT